MNKDGDLAISQHVSATISQKTIDWVANSFDTSDPKLSLVPLKWDEQWETLPMLASRWPHTPMLGMFSPISQLERGFSMALRREHLPVMCIPPVQARALPTLLRNVSVGAIVSLWADRAQLDGIEYAEHVFHEVVLGVRDRPERYDRPGMGFEIHLVPGLVGFLQCDALAGKNSFHPSERFHWKFRDDVAFVTDGRPEQQFEDVRLPGSVHVEPGSCTCGRNIIVSLQ